jgi:uncharacterized membrane protein YeaQ/YmgE (transglycosylase-associated protein family)
MVFTNTKQKPLAAVKFDNEMKGRPIMDPMGLIVWLVVGAVAGFLASLVIPTRMGLVGDMVVGVIGGVVGGALFNAIGEPGVTGLSLWSIFVAFIGSVLLLGLARLFSGPVDDVVTTPYRDDTDWSRR